MDARVIFFDTFIDKVNGGQALQDVFCHILQVVCLLLYYDIEYCHNHHSMLANPKNYLCGGITIGYRWLMIISSFLEKYLF